MKDLEGKTIGGLKINDEKDALFFDIKGGISIVVSAVGDCCSKSWFEHIEGVEALIGKKIVKVVERDMPGPKEYDEGNGLIQFYGWTLELDSGERVDFEMRNDSNGYYGGWVEVHSTARDQYQDHREDIKGIEPLVASF